MRSEREAPVIAVVPVLTAGKLEPALRRRMRSGARLLTASCVKVSCEHPPDRPRAHLREEFASIQKGLSLNSIVTGTIVLISLGQLYAHFGLFFAVVIT